MLIAIIGENCTGKTTIANQLKDIRKFEIYSGKDYLRLCKNPQQALSEFLRLLICASCDENDLIWIISEFEYLKLLPNNAYKILVTADLEVIKERFSKRMRGVLPIPVEKMLERNHGIFDNIDFDIKIKSDEIDKSQLQNFINKFKSN